MADQQVVGIDRVRQTWRDQGVDAAEALYLTRPMQVTPPTRWWMLGCELAAARADLPAVLQRWQSGWDQAAQQPALRQALVEWLWTTPWDRELAPLWQRVSEDTPGKPAWRKEQVQRGVALRRPTGARALMARVDQADNTGNWWPQVLALWAGEGDEAFVATWMRHLDSRWLTAGDAHSNFTPDPGAFSRLEHWVQGGHAGVIAAWRARVPAGAWADWLEQAERVAHWRAGNGLWSAWLNWPDSVLNAWPKAVQRQALARLALQAEQTQVLRQPWLETMEQALARHWPRQAALRTTAQIELSWLLDNDVDGAHLLDWLEARAPLEELRSWWSARALRECLRQPGGLQRWFDWCERYGAPELAPGVEGHDAVAALCLSGRESQAEALLADWRDSLAASGSASDRAWLAVSQITLAIHQQQTTRAWQTLNDWWQTLGLTPLATGTAFSPQALLDAAAATSWPAAQPWPLPMPVTAVMLWPGMGDTQPGAEDDARLTLRSLLMQDAPDLQILVVTDRPLTDADLPPGSRAVQEVRVDPDLEVSGRTDEAIDSVTTPWMIWATPGFVWHPQALRARQLHLAQHPQAAVSMALQLAITEGGHITVLERRSGLAAGQDGYMLRTDLARGLPPVTLGYPDGWAVIRERIERQLGSLGREVWHGPMGLQVVSTGPAASSSTHRGLRARHRRALMRLVGVPQTEDLVGAD
ncbi:hypothetical protein KAK07_07190 [Ideonella sp. 4Y16]|uniref:hypothetical protein n=1 Tax=Ideonella alba TaxID=2824118 RepID=UPI001B37BCC6|nr:hypothetical protein [Ideonella alba]MBQ0943116.1 hypothetical protein [Ideonella alba]